MNLRLLLILSVISISSTCFSQKYAILKGRITPSTQLFISWYTDPLAGTIKEIEIKCDIKSGLFQARIPINKPTFMHFAWAFGNKILLIPGDTAQVNIKNHDGLLTTTFIGKDSARFNFAQRLIRRIEQSYTVTHDSLSVIENEHRQNLERYNRFAKLNDRHLRFKNISRLLISFAYHHKLLLYYINNSTKQEFPANVFGEIDPGDLNESDMFFFDSYLEFLYDFNRYYYSHGKDGIIANELIENAKSKFTGAVRDALLFHTFRKLTSDCDLQHKTTVLSLRNSLMKIFAQDQGKLSVINKLYRQYQSIQQPVPPEILKTKLLTDHGQQVTIEDLLRGHNKPLYLDFWASWCGYCIEEMKVSKKIYPEMNDKISFVYISNERDKMVWKKGIDKIKVNGTHLLLNDDQNRLFNTYFGIEGIPHYAIIDKSGRLIHLNAPRPSELNKLKKVIDPLLSKQPVAFSK